MHDREQVAAVTICPGSGPNNGNIPPAQWPAIAVDHSRRLYRIRRTTVRLQDGASHEGGGQETFRPDVLGRRAGTVVLGSSGQIAAMASISIVASLNSE